VQNVKFTYRYLNCPTREKEILSLIHADICGPINVESVGGAQYFITFIDECLQYVEVVMLRNKSDALQVFIIYYNRKVDNLIRKHIKKLRTDNGKEYIFKELALFKE